MSVLTITGARLLDGRGSAPVDDAVLIAEHGVIRYAGPASGAPSAGGETIDAAGRTLIPGLIDCHVHLQFDGDANFEAEAYVSEPVAALKAARNARRTLEAGITTVRDLGGVGTSMIAVSAAQRDGVVSGPRIVTTGEVLTITGGHGHFIGRECDTTEELVKGVRSLAKAGASCIKIIATGGVLTAGIGAQRSAFSVEQLRAAIAEAHEAGLRVAAHAIGRAGIEAAIAAGVDSIEHGCYLSDEAIEQMDGNPTWLVPTLVAPHQIIHGGEGIPAYAVDKSREVSIAHAEAFGRAVKAGVRIAAGTDAGTPFNRHGEMWRELWLMSENGMPLDRVLQAATSQAAGLIGLPGLGVLAEGYAADAVLLDGDPLSDVGAYRSVSAVVQAGRVVA